MVRGLLLFGTRCRGSPSLHSVSSVPTRAKWILSVQWCEFQKLSALFFFGGGGYFFCPCTLKTSRFQLNSALLCAAIVLIESPGGRVAFSFMIGAKTMKVAAILEMSMFANGKICADTLPPTNISPFYSQVPWQYGGTTVSGGPCTLLSPRAPLPKGQCLFDQKGTWGNQQPV